MDLVSVIVPAYNIQNYIRRCVDSIRNQTYSELEILLIDDGSTDDTGELCDEFAQQDERITVYHKKTEDFLRQEIMELNVLMELICHL